MSQSIDLKMAELLCSRLCHDLSSPITATLNCIGLLGEETHHEAVAETGSQQKEALDLMARSGAMASHRLAFYRLAFGYVGESTATLELADLRMLAANYLQGGNLELRWGDDEGALSGKVARFVVNLILLGKDALVRGGELSVQFAALSEGVGVALAATGRGAGLSDEVKTILLGEASEELLTVRTVQGFLTHALAEELGAQLEIVDDLTDETRITAVIPS